MHQTHGQVLVPTGAISDFDTDSPDDTHDTQCEISSTKYQTTQAQGVGVAFTKPQLSILPLHMVIMSVCFSGEIEE